MPVHVVKASGGGFNIVEKSGKVVGHSDTKAKAQSSANARNASAHGWKPTGKKK
jgi:hypothetical protein